MRSYSDWILCPSKSFPGKFYYFNVRNGKAAWGPGDAEIIAGRPPETPKETESHNHPERNSPPDPDPLQQDFFVSSIQQTQGTRHMVTPFSSIQQTPETRHGVTPFSYIQQTPETRHEDNLFSSLHHPTANSFKQNCLLFSSMGHSTPVFGQKTFPRGLPKQKDSNVICTPIQTQVHIPLQNQASTTFHAEYPAFRDQPNILNADRSQDSQSTEGLKYIVTQGLGDEECQEVLVNASNVPMHQRFVNFETPGIIFSKINKDNIKRLNQKLKSSTPIKKSKVIEDLRLVNKPKVFESKSSLNFADFKTITPDFKPNTGNSFLKKSASNFKLFSNTKKQDFNVRLPTQIQEPRNQSVYVGPSITTPVFNGGLLTKSREPQLSNGLPSKSIKTSLNFETSVKTKETCVNFGPPSKITEPLFNLEPPLKSKESDLYFESQTEPPIFNAGSHFKTKETVLNFDPSLKTKEPVVNRLPLQTNEPVFNGQGSKAKCIVLNRLPSKPTDKEDKSEPKSVLKGCVKSMKSCIKGDKGDNTVTKSFVDDLRAVLISKRKSQDFSNADFQASKPKMSKQETPVKKKVTFNLDHESISMVSSMEDAEDMKCAFVELYRPTLSYLKALGPSSSQDSWCILADAEVLTTDFEFIHDFVQIDPTCKLLIPPVVHSWLLSLARGCDRPLATAARNVLRRTTSSHVVVQPCNDDDHEKPTYTNDAVLRCCVENMDQNKHLVLISNDLELLTTAKCYPIPCYSINSIKNGLPATKQLQYKKDMKITIRNDTADNKNDSFNKNSLRDHELNDKEMAVIRSLQISKYPIGQNPTLKEKNQYFQNEKPNVKHQNDQTATGPNEKNQNPVKYFYHDENMRIADAIEMYHTDSASLTTSVHKNGTTTGTHDVSNASTVHNESMDIMTYFQSMEIDKPIVSMNNENSTKVKKPAEAGWRFESDTTKTNIEDDIQKLCIKDMDRTNPMSTDKPVTVSFKNQKSVDLKQFDYSEKMKISPKNDNTPATLTENNKQIEKENQEPYLKNNDTRLEIKKSIDSIFEFCKEKPKEPPTTEYESGKTNMAYQCQKILFELENGKTYMASQYDRTKCEYQNGKTNMSSQLDGSKSNMASTSNGFDVSKPQTTKNRIDLKRFYVKSKDVEHRLKARMDEWVCFYTQIMEDALSGGLQNESPSVINSPAPWSLFEALQCIDAVYEGNSYVNKIVGHICSCLYESRYKMKECIRPEEFMRALGCGAKLLEYLGIILPSIIEFQDGVTALLALLNQLEDDTDPTIGLSDPPVPTHLHSNTEELNARKNFVKDKSEVTDYLKKHYAVWEDYDSSVDIKVFRTRGEKEIKLEKKAKGKNVKNKETIDGNLNVNYVDVAHSTAKTNNVGKYCRDKSNVDDMDRFELDRNKNIGVRKKNYDGKKTGAIGENNKHVENNIKYKHNKAKDGKVRDVKGPTIIRNVSILKDFETKLKKKKTKQVNVNIKPVKKPKIDVKTASDENVYNDIDIKHAKINGNPKNNVYRPEEDPKLIYSPRVVIEANLISDYEEKMRLKKAKKLFYSDQSEDNDNNSNKTDNEHHTTKRPPQYILSSYNGNNNNHIVTNVIKNHKGNDKSDHNDNQVTNIKNNLGDDDNDNNNNKDVTTDSGLGNELPRWSSVVDSYTAEIEKNFTFIKEINSEQLASVRGDSAAETYRMRAFEVDYLVCRTLGVLRTLLQQSTDEEDRARNVDAVAKYMLQAKSIHELVNSILSATNYLLPVSSGMSFNS